MWDFMTATNLGIMVVNISNGNWCWAIINLIAAFGCSYLNRRET